MVGTSDDKFLFTTGLRREVIQWSVEMKISLKIIEFPNQPGLTGVSCIIWDINLTSDDRYLFVNFTKRDNVKMIKYDIEEDTHDYLNDEDFQITGVCFSSVLL